jgi:glycine cleavage system H protein
MDPLLTFAESALIFLAGLLVRFLIALAGLALVVIPILAVFMAVRYIREMRDRSRGLEHAGNLLAMRGLFYAPGHTWMKEESPSAVRVGLDDLARRLLTGIRALKVAEPGTELRRGDTLAEVTLDGRTTRIVAPMDATVVDTNDDVEQTPDIVQRDPYRKGWLALLAPVSGDFRRMPTGEAARQWLEGEDQRLTVFFEARLGAAAADGGEYVLPPPALLKPEQWDEVEREFLDIPTQR